MDPQVGPWVDVPAGIQIEHDGSPVSAFVNWWANTAPTSTPLPVALASIVHGSRTATIGRNTDGWFVTDYGAGSNQTLEWPGFPQNGKNQAWPEDVEQTRDPRYRRSAWANQFWLFRPDYPADAPPPGAYVEFDYVDGYQSFDVAMTALVAYTARGETLPWGVNRLVRPDRTWSGATTAQTLPYLEDMLLLPSIADVPIGLPVTSTTTPTGGWVAQGRAVGVRVPAADKDLNGLVGLTGILGGFTGTPNNGVAAIADVRFTLPAYRWRFVYPPVKGMWRLRQKQSLPGTDSWPLRQRQNGGATGSWPLRQRQSGM